VLIIFALVAIVAMFFLARSLFILIFSMENYNVHRKRLKQLQFNNKKEDMEMTELIDKVTKPVIRHIFPKLKPRNLEQLERDLKMAKWDKNFTPIQYRALSLTLKVVGLVAGVLLYTAVAPFMGILWGVLLIFGMDFLLRNSKNNRKAKLIADFPDFIRITEGYLSANVSFSQAVAESIKYVGEEWKPILQNFVVECDVKSIDEALESLRTDVDLFEVREFVSLVKLTLEQGGSASESFSAQADKVREMQLDAMALKIGKRQMMATALQAPLLLCIMAIMGLPMVESMTGLSSM
jgi:Flp pilus assembly protein TadB